MRRVEQALAAAAVVIFGWTAWHFVTSPLPDVLAAVPDDAFYYLKIARSLAVHGRSTADGFSTTNGYHPLWMLLCTGLAAVIHDKVTLLRAAMGLSFALDAALAGALVWALSAVVTTRIAAAAGVCWLINACAFQLASQTVEAMPYGIALVVFFGLHLRLSARLRAGAGMRTADAVVCGVALGVAVLARTEAVAVAAVWLTWLICTRHASRDLLVRARLAGIAAATLVLVISPWLLFSFLQTGTIVQDSGAMKTLWMARAHPTLGGHLYNLLVTEEYFVRQTLRRLTGTLVPGVFLLAICVVIAWRVYAAHARNWRSASAAAMRAAILPVAVVWLIDGLTLDALQAWWLVLPSLAWVIVVTVCAADAVERTLPAVPPIVVLLALGVFVRWHQIAEPQYPWQADVWRSEPVIDALVPAGATRGCFNAGIPMFFSDRPIVAMDGLVDHRAVGYWHASRLDAFIAAQHIRYISDERMTLDHARPFMEQPVALTVVRTFPLRGWPTPERVLWRVGR